MYIRTMIPNCKKQVTLKALVYIEMLHRAHVNVFVLLKEFHHFYQNPKVEGPFQIRRGTHMNCLYLKGAEKAMGQGGQT